MKKQEKIKNFKEIFDIIFDVTSNLPFLLFFIVPFLYDNINGYSLIICIPIATLFIILSSYSWLELKSRYILLNAPKLYNSKRNGNLFRNRLNLNDDQLEQNRLNFFSIFESTIGINLTVLIFICYIINGLCLHCIIIKWFFEDITKHLFHFLDDDHIHESCSLNDTKIDVLNSTSNFEYRSIQLRPYVKNHSYSSDEHVLFKTNSIMKAFELLTNFIYFISLIIFKFFITKFQLSKNVFKEYKFMFSKSNRAPQLNTRNESTVNIEANNGTSDLKFLNKTIKLSTIKKSFSSACFYFLIILILSFTLSTSSFSIRINCIAIFSSSLYNVIFNEFTKLRKSKRHSFGRLSIKREINNIEDQIDQIKKFLNIMIKLGSLCIFIILFIILVNTFSNYRNTCCVEYLESLLNETNHTKHIVKQLCLTFICFYIFKFSHSNLKLVIENSSELADYLFNLNHENNSNRKLSQALVNENLNNNEMNDTNNNEIYTLTTHKLNEPKSTCFIFNFQTNCFNKANAKLNKIDCSILVLFFSITLVYLALIEKNDLIYTWSLSFLTINLIIISIVLLINYFPYQVLTDFNSGNMLKKSAFFRAREEAPLIREQNEQEQQLNKPIVASKKENTNLDEELEDDEGEVIENAFAKHKQELKKKALSNKSLSFGIDQPSMSSGYKAVSGYFLFILCSITLSIIINYLANELFELDNMNLSRIFLLISFLIMILGFLIFFSLIFLIRNLKETIYIKHLHYKSPYLPYLQLVLLFVNVFFILKSSFSILVIFYSQFLIYFICLFVSYKVYVFIKVKTSDHSYEDNGYMPRWSKSMDGSKLNIFTIGAENFKKPNSSNSMMEETNDDDNDDGFQLNVVNDNQTYVSISSKLNLIK